MLPTSTPSGLSRTRPDCQCSHTEDPTTISLKFKGLVEASDGTGFSSALDTAGSLSSWNILRLWGTKCSCDVVQPHGAKPPPAHQARFIIEATTCPVAGSAHSIFVVSDIATRDSGCTPCNFDLTHFHHQDDVALFAASSKTLLDLALITRFIIKRVSCERRMDQDGASGCDAILCILVPILTEDHYPWVDSPIPNMRSCRTKMPSHEILALICEHERERKEESVRALARAELERTERLWSVLTLTLKLEKLENQLSAESTEQCAYDQGGCILGEEYHLAFHFGRALPGECHYIQ